jgi:outer membrane protein
MLNRIAVALLLASTLTGPSAALAQSKIAVVDSVRAAQNCVEGLKAQAMLKKLFDNRQIELEAKQQQLAKEKEAIEREAQAGKTNKDAVQRKYEAWQKQALEVQNTFIAYQKEMTRKQQELMHPIEESVRAAVARLAKEGGYDLVVERSAASYFRGDLELTERVIEMLNAPKK